jgi:predicted ATPase
VQLPLYAIPNWAARSRQLPEGPRDGVPFLPTDRLGLLGWNLGAAWAELRNRESRHWEHTLDLLRLGLGEGLDSVFVQPGAGGQSIFLALKYHHLPEPLFAAQLSDGQLSWLAFVAMCRLGGRRSLLAVDEPERHLHPHLLHRVLDLLQEQGDQLPVLICTHDDRLLDMVEDPARSIRVLEQEGARVHLRRLAPASLGPWLEEYGGVGSLRRAGHLPLVLAAPEGGAP